MNINTKQLRYQSFLERKYKRLIEESYNIQFTDHGLSDILTYEAMQIDQKMRFLRLA